MKSIFSSCLRKTIILISFCFTSTVIFGDIIQSGGFSPIEFNMVFEGENSEKSVSAVAKSYYSRNELGGTVTIRRINHSQAWGFVMEKGDTVDVEFNITSGGTYGLNVYCVPKNYNQLNSALPNGNVWPTEIRKYTTGTNMGDTKSFKIEVSCISEYEGSKTYVVTKNGNERAHFTVAGGQFFIVAFLDEDGATNHDYNLGYTIRVKKTSNPTATPTPFPPQMVFASQGDYPDKILVGWGSMSEGYDSPLYKVYRSESFSGKKILIGETSESTYEDTTAVYGKTYYYWIKGVNGDKESEYSTWEADGWLGEPNLWTVSFNANGGSGSMSSQTFSNGTSQALKANTFTRSGYEFIGWATSSSGSVVYSDQQSISLSANKTLYAVWKVIAGAFDLVFGNLASKNWKQGFFLNNTSNDVSVMHSFLLGETIYRNFFFANTGNEILKDEFNVLHEVLNSDGTVRHSYTQFSNYEYAQNYGRYWSNNPWESGLGNLPVGSYIYRCTIDSENVIPESNESNNVFEYSFSIIDASHEDSLLEALGIGKFAVTVGGDAEWFAQKDVTHDGVSAVQSGDISDNQTSWMEVVVKNVSSVSFWWKVSSESGWDKLHFYVDGTEVVEPISGESDWIKVEHALTTDSHTLKWVYTKDGSVSNGDDCGWVDSVVLMPVRGKVQLWAGGPYWATTNVGAENPEDYGYYFWWGDTVGYKRKNDCWVASNGSSYDFSFVSSNVPTYGKDTATLQSEGWITSDGVLAPEHDAANVHWGNGWRMPTYKEIEDLYNNCDWICTTVNGVDGFVVCGKGNYSANSIFLPCAGYSIGTSLNYAGSDGSIASSVPCSDISVEDDAYNRAWTLYFMGNWIDYYHMNKGSRHRGHSVRAVQNVTCLTVTFDTCGGSSVDSVSIPLGQTLGELPIPTRDGYTFLGWFTAADGGEQVTADTVVTGDMTLYAHWEEVLKEPSFEIDDNGVLSSVELNGATEIIIPSNVKVIADEALSGCCDLTSVTIPEGVVSIGYDAFNCCCALTSINIPSTVTNIGDNAFGNCTNLRIVTGGEGLKRVGIDAFYDTLFLYGEDSWEDVESNGDYINDYGLDLVRLGNFIVGRRGSLEEARNDEYYDEDGNWIWEYNLVIPEGVTGIADSLFEDLPITSVTIPGSIKRIPENAFNSCCYLKNLTINEGVEEIGDYAFQRAGSYLEEDGITTLTIPSSVTKIGEYGFASLGCLKYVVGLDDADDVHSDAFYGTPYADGWEAPVLIIEDGVVYGLDRETRFDDGCITNNVLYIPEGVTNIADCAFKEMYEFSKAVLPSSLRSIGHEAFYDCEELREVEGGVNLERVGYNVFNETLFLYKADSWEDVESNGDYLNDYGLDLVCLGNFIVGRRGSLAEAENDEYYDDEGNWIWKYELVIPEGVTGLADELFNDLPITSVTIPNSIVSIPDYTFTYTELESVVIPENIVSIGEEAFASCANLKYAKVPLALKSQVEEGNVFAYCSPDLQIEYYDNASLVAPVITPCDGTEFYEDSCIVTITCETEGALIYYTTDGTTPRPRPTNLYTGAFEIADTTTVKAIAVKGEVRTDLVSATIVKKEIVLAAPVITPTDGTEFYEDSCTVTISCATEGASIYYVVCDTNNVTNPRPSDRNLYTGPFTVSATKMVRAFSMFGSKTSDIVSSTLIKRELTLPVAVDAPELTFTTGSDAKWTPEFNGSAKVGGSLAQSGALSWSEADCDPSETWMETTVAGVGTFSFWWKVDCEDDPFGCTWDRLEVYTNGVEAARIDGKTEWEKMEFAFADSRTHTVRWRFYKDDWDDEKLTDLAWVDGVVWTPASTDITVDVGGGRNVVVPVSWIDTYDNIVTAAGGDKVAALMFTAANGRKVWECFMLGIDPTKADDDFKITRFWMENSKPMFEFSHSVDGAGNSFAPRIKTKGKAKLSDSWSDVPTGGDSSFRFFTVEVMLP